MTPLIIGLTGKKGHGKTTATNKLAEVLMEKGYYVQRHNFKDALIHTMRTKLNRTLTLLGEHYNLTQQELFDQKPPMMRTLMQEVGTEIYRGMKDDWWVLEWYKNIFEIIKLREKEPKLAIITDDVRFLNEATILQAKRGVLIRIVREDYEDSVATTHQSEIEMDGIQVDHTITAKDKDELEAKIVDLCSKLETL